MHRAGRETRHRSSCKSEICEIREDFCSRLGYRRHAGVRHFESKPSGIHFAECESDERERYRDNTALDCGQLRGYYIQLPFELHYSRRRHAASEYDHHSDSINRTYANGAFRCRTAQNLTRCTLSTPRSLLLVLLELHTFASVLLDYSPKNSSILCQTGSFIGVSSHLSVR